MTSGDSAERPSPGQRSGKGDLRRRLRAARLGRDGAADDLADRVLALSAVASARTVTLYASLPGEPGTATLRQALAERGVRVLLPVTLDDLDLDWAVDPGVDADLGSGRLGIDEPTGPRLGVAAVATADVVVSPALAVTADGDRLGQGGGCYDRALARVPAGVPVVALVFDDEVLDALPVEPHDRRVSVVVTPTRTLVVPPHRGVTVR